MIKSMTAFSRIEKDIESAQLCWEIRSVNHRYLDSSVYLPEVLQDQESTYKELIRKQLGRGKIDAKLVINFQENSESNEIKLNEEKIQALISAQNKIRKITNHNDKLTTMEILSWPGVVSSLDTDFSEYSDQAKLLFEDALNGLLKSREEEGERLQKLIVSRGESIKHITSSVRKRRNEVISGLREKIVKRLTELSEPADNNRLEQEMVYLSQRLDVDEELDRLDSHIEELTAVLKRKEPVGRRLDFLMQELNREANTLASKSNDAETTKGAVDLKVLIEQMREQCLNIE